MAEETDTQTLTDSPTGLPRRVPCLMTPDSPAVVAAAHGSPTDAEILDWLQTNCRHDWRFGNEIHFTARCLSLHPFKHRPTLREAVSAAIKSGNAATLKKAHEYDRLNWWCQGWLRKLNDSIRVCNRLSGDQRDKLASVIGKLRDRFHLACERRKPAAEALLQRKPNDKDQATRGA